MKKLKYPDLMKITILNKNGVFTFIEPSMVIISKGTTVLYKWSEIDHIELPDMRPTKKPTKGGP